MMSASVTGKKQQCITCNKSGGIMICDGCQQSFCGKHVIKHRQELTNQLDGILQEHDQLQQELEQSSVDNSLVEQINKWEEESITKIQVAAEAARADLQQILDTSKKQISMACHEIVANLQSSRDGGDFSEHDLNRWMEQLKEFKMEITSSPVLKLINDEYSAIPWITITHNSFINKTSVKSNKQSNILKNSVVPVPQERFSQVFGAVILQEEGILANHVSRNGEYVHILGERLYSQGRQVVRFKIGYTEAVYNIFFGCISSTAINEEICYISSVSVGWFGCYQTWQHGNVNPRGYDSSKIKTNDVLSLTFDCEKQQIELYHERENRTYNLQVDTGLAPFPWRLLVVLCRSNNYVRILPNISCNVDMKC